MGKIKRFSDYPWRCNCALWIGERRSKAIIKNVRTRISTYRGAPHFLPRVRRRLKVLPKCEARRKRGMSSVSLASFHACGVRSRLFRTFIEATEGIPTEKEGTGRWTVFVVVVTRPPQGGFFFRRNRRLRRRRLLFFGRRSRIRARGPKVRDTARKWKYSRNEDSSSRGTIYGGDLADAAWPRFFLPYISRTRKHSLAYRRIIGGLCADIATRKLKTKVRKSSSYSRWIIKLNLNFWKIIPSNISWYSHLIRY